MFMDPSVLKIGEYPRIFPSFSWFTAFSYDAIINLFSVTSVLHFEPLPSRVRDWLNRL